MFRGLYTAASGMLSQQSRIEMLTNNIANANTPGYKADQASLRAFPELFMQRLEQPTVPTAKPLSRRNRTPIGTLHTGVYMQELRPNFAQGDLRETGNRTDLALVDGTLPTDPYALFFTVQNADGAVRYTRNGHFTLDADGFLTTDEGFYVLDENGDRIQLGSDDFTVLADGTIMQNDEIVARLGVAFAADKHALVKEGNGLFRSENGELPQANGQAYQIRQGFLERSNVDLSRTMTDMLSAYRAFEANQKILQAYDKSMDKAVNEIGRLK
ncbi:flagellar basal-body rod protein FlgG [Thermolongibacillus altinsuensis]|uniref:Flagellar basal-body rod protein FlgG n=1 Tax=Thermolongibacillus altinsuensis TaxID=575256 RepID=A0A4R1QGU9_9BACL|nr:flagellar basal-body rod protein FlgF [Thermolongibacillus altinsuensis]TCL52759.1 flagellar basal-body rod protein FlgG [Thermolongibacillus altinsuensis]GMB09405.1 flagellar hook-basal body complex protein FlhO [Thermolongibacillus altinsuensis]